MDSAIVAYVKHALSSYRSEDRAIAFCRTKHQAHALAKLFNVSLYHAVHQDEELLEKNRETKQKWLSGENKVMVSTSLLGCGMDYPHIRDVIHRDPSFSMLDQYQEDSRGGRDGLECRATTFVVDKKKYRAPDQPYNLGTQILYDSMDNICKCRRIDYTVYLDGKAVQCVSLPSASFCDYCDSSAGISSSINANTTCQRLHSSNNLPVVNRLTFQGYSPPRRSPDLFDPPPRVDLRDFLLPVKRKSQSSDSISSPLSTSSKKFKLSDSTLLNRYFLFSRTIIVE